MPVHRKLAAALILALFGCNGGSSVAPSGKARRPFVLAAQRQDERDVMVDLIATYSAEHRVRAPGVLAAMRKVARHDFVPAAVADRAYGDYPLPIGEGQTISQPFIVGTMTEVLEVKPGDRVLEIGTGSGYQAAILGELAREVYTIEIIEPLARRSRETLERLGYKNVFVRAGDGYRGWPEAAPFDSIIVTCAPDHIPRPLVNQLRIGGLMVIPVGQELRGVWSAQQLVVVRKTPKGMERQAIMDVQFVPMTGEAQKASMKKRLNGGASGIRTRE